MNLIKKIISKHLVEGNKDLDDIRPGHEIGLKIDQVLLQDATGTLVMLELEALKLERAEVEVAVQYVDHNLLQADFKNADDHVFLQSAAQKFGFHFSRAGNGVSHAVHMQYFGIPGKTLLGSDSHTCAAGSMGMFAMGTGGLDVSFALLGEPYYIKMPKVLGVHVTGELPDWVSAKDVILELLRRRDVDGGVGYVLEYYGEGLKNLSAMDRHVIANMGAELGATSSLFPSDERTREFLKLQNREDDFVELCADSDAKYDDEEDLNLSELEPLIACPSSPGQVVPVREVEGKNIHQAVVGSSANPGYRDYWIVAEILKDRKIAEHVSLDINPSSRQISADLTFSGSLTRLYQAGARIHQAGCLGCIGMGQAPGSGKISLRTMPRNFPGRSGTEDDKVYLCSPETAAASALQGKITDPRNLEKIEKVKYPVYKELKKHVLKSDLIIPAADDPSKIVLEKGPNIKSLPTFTKPEDSFKVPVILKMEDNISTDEILKAGTDVLPFRSNIPEISKWCFSALSSDFYDKSKEAKEKWGGHIVIGGSNYAQGSSREHAALAPRYLGQTAVLAKSYARIGWQNLINFGILPLEFENAEDYDKINSGDFVHFENIREGVKMGKIKVTVKNNEKNSKEVLLKHSMSSRQIEVVLSGGLIPYFKSQKEG